MLITFTGTIAQSTLSAAPIGAPASGTFTYDAMPIFLADFNASVAQYSPVVALAESIRIDNSAIGDTTLDGFGNDTATVFVSTNSTESALRLDVGSDFLVLDTFEPFLATLALPDAIPAFVTDQSALAAITIRRGDEGSAVIAIDSVIDATVSEPSTLILFALTIGVLCAFRALRS